MRNRGDFHLLRSVANFDDEQVSIEGNLVVIENAVMNREIGPFSRGEMVGVLRLDLNTATLEEVGWNKKLLRSVELTLEVAP